MDVIVEREGPVSVLRWNRASKRNAITAAMYAQMTALLSEAEADSTVRAIVIAGGAKAFSAGNDLEDFLLHPPVGIDAPVMQFIRTIASISKPLVAAVCGSAVGIGTTMLLHCDIVYASSDARFALPFTQLGLCPEAASSLLLPRLAGYQRAAEKLLLGDPFDAEEARQMGLVSRVLESEHVEIEALRQAGRLAKLPTSALRTTKALLKADPTESTVARVAREAEQFETLLNGPAAREALLAFTEKRRPDFSAID